MVMLQKAIYIDRSREEEEEEEIVVRHCEISGLLRPDYISLLFSSSSWAQLDASLLYWAVSEMQPWSRSLFASLGAYNLGRLRRCGCFMRRNK